jgi:outer membrane lipoprotein-sorting protein
MTDSELENRLEALGRAMPEAENFVPLVLARVTAASPMVRGRFYGSWFMKASIGAAASVLVGVAIWTLISPPPAAFAMADLPQRLRSFPTLHLKGTIYPPQGGAGRPFELFIQRPDHLRINGLVGALHDGKLVVGPDQLMLVDAQAKTVTVRAETSVDSRVFFEEIYQSEVLSLMLGPSTQGEFKKVRSETLSGGPADVYELSPGSGRTDVWINRVSGLPVKSQTYGRSGQLIEDDDVIEIGIPIPQAAFGFQPPADYKVIHIDTAPHLKERVFGNLVVEIRFVFDLHRHGDLLCWRLYDRTRPAREVDLDKEHVRWTFRSPKGDYTEQLLHADPDPRGGPWRWSLLKPPNLADAGERNGDVFIALRKDGKELALGLEPVQFEDDELKGLVEQAQLLTMPAGSIPVPLEQMEDQLAQ